ncbi:MAG: hypothetical protein R3C12_05170 [Planctomycetaceae bacterium]|nr:hypothetical protein [Planctomycetaceae bacterium]
MDPNAAASRSESAVSLPTRTHYRAPRENEQLLCQPAGRQSPRLIALQHEKFRISPRLFWGETLASWRASARRECLDQAICFTATIDDSPCIPLDASLPLIATGHQPELFHPGVWVKNVWAARQAEWTGGIALNLIVDSDTVKTRSVPIPLQGNGQLRETRIEIDDWPIGIPWEETRVVHADKFRGFADRLLRTMAPLREAPLLVEYWQAVCGVWEQNGLLTRALVAGRRRIEHKLGLHTLELPVSLLSQTPSFLRFVTKLAGDAARFRSVYNSVLQRYRRLYQLKSPTHPIPDLACEGEWIELPFWIWDDKNPRRRGVFTRSKADSLEFSDREGLHWRLSHAELAGHNVPRLAEWLNQGIRLRPRALITTLYFRLFVSDWFIHGIGGAKYDEITDGILQDYFGVEPPCYQVATATLWLPLADAPRRPGRTAREFRQALRRAQENPELLLPRGEARLEQLLIRKHQLIEAWRERPRHGLTQRQRRERRQENLRQHRELQEVREELTRLAGDAVHSLREELYNAEKVEADWKVAAFREYPFVCYPESSLRRLIQQVSRERPEDQIHDQ